MCTKLHIQTENNFYKQLEFDITNHTKYFKGSWCEIFGICYYRVQRVLNQKFVPYESGFERWSNRVESLLFYESIKVEKERDSNRQSWETREGPEEGERQSSKRFGGVSLERDDCFVGTTFGSTIWARQWNKLQLNIIRDLVCVAEFCNWLFGGPKGPRTRRGGLLPQSVLSL